MAVASLVSGLTSSWPLSLRASSLLSSSPLELHPLSVYEISFIVLFDIAEIALLVKFFFSFFYLPPSQAIPLLYPKTIPNTRSRHA